MKSQIQKQSNVDTNHPTALTTLYTLYDIFNVIEEEFNIGRDISKEFRDIYCTNLGIDNTQFIGGEYSYSEVLINGSDLILE